MPKHRKPPIQHAGFSEEAAAFEPGVPPPPLKATTDIGRDGRIVIPAAMREAMGVKEGSKLVLLMKGETLEVFTVEAGVRRVQRLVRQWSKGGRSMVDELLEDRRREVEDEESS